MKILESADRMVIDNSLAMPVATGIVLAIGGVLVGVLGSMNHILWLPLLGLALIVMGGLLVAFSKSVHVELVKSGDSRIASKTLFSQATTHAFALSDISSVLLQCSQTQRLRKDADGDRHYEMDATSVLYLKTRDASLMRIGTNTRTVNIGGVVGALIQSMPLKQEAMQVATFIGVPLQTSDAVGLGTNTHAAP